MALIHAVIEFIAKLAAAYMPFRVIALFTNDYDGIEWTKVNKFSQEMHLGSP